MALSTSQLRVAWGPACALTAPTVVTLHGGGRVRVDGRIVPAVDALNRALTAHDYRTRQADTGAYNCRRITGGTGYSLHAFGIALDLNWVSNPYGKKLVTDMPRAMVDDILAIRTVSGRQVWRWGGDYVTNKDAMHYEVVCAPADLATGIVAPVRDQPPISGIPHRVIRPGETGPDVVAVQWTVTYLGHPVAVDGVYGPRTVAAVKSLQSALNQLGARLYVDGIWGPATANLAEWWTAAVSGKK